MRRQREGNAQHDQRDDHARRNEQAGDHGIGRAPHFRFAVEFFLFLEHRNERRRERAFAQQPAEEIGNGERV